MENSVIWGVVSAGFFLSGLFMLFSSLAVVLKLKKFYRQYPLIHHAGEKQLTSRLLFVRLLGGVLIFMGVILLYSSSGL